MTGKTNQGDSGSAGGQTTDYQTSLDSIAESIRRIQAPVDGDAGEYHGVGLNSSMLEATSAMGKIAGSVVDGFTGTPTFKTSFEAASGLGEGLAGNHDKASEHYTAATVALTEDGLAGAAVAIHRAVEHIKDGEWSEALGEAADAVGDVVGTITSPIGRTIERVSEQVSQATELFNQGSKMYDNAAQDADYALAVENSATMRDSAVARLQERYTEIVEEARRSGYEPRVESWHQARTDSAAAADALGFTPDYSSPGAEAAPTVLSPSMDVPLSPEQYSPGAPTYQPDPLPSADDIALPPIGELGGDSTSDTAIREPAGVFPGPDSDLGVEAVASLDSETIGLNEGTVTADAPGILEELFGPQDLDLTDNVAGAGELERDLEEAEENLGSELPASGGWDEVEPATADGSDSSGTTPDTAGEGGNDWLSSGSSGQYNLGEEVVPTRSDQDNSVDEPSVLEELFGVQDYDLTDNSPLEDLTQSSGPALQVATGLVDDGPASASSADLSNSSGGDWSDSSNTDTSGDSSGGDWGASSSGNGPIVDAGDSGSSDYSGSELSASDVGTSDAGGSSFDADDSSGGDDSSSGTVV